MERRRRGLKRKAYYARKIKTAAQILFYKSHKKPGAKGWELKKVLGSDYPKVLAILNSHLEKLGLQIKTVFEEPPIGKPSPDQLTKARFYVALRETLTPKMVKFSGWRIDDIAGLAVSISLITSRKGKTSRDEVEDFLRVKLPGWRVEMNVNRYIRYGYLEEDEKKQLYLGWRTIAEVDQKALIDLIMAK